MAKPECGNCFYWVDGLCSDGGRWFDLSDHPYAGQPRCQDDEVCPYYRARRSPAYFFIGGIHPADPRPGDDCANLQDLLELLPDASPEGSPTGSGSSGQRDYSAGLAAPLIARLQGVIPAGASRWYTRCPAHDDKSPSLSIRDDGERALIHCFVEYDPSDVLTAVGLEWKNLYRDRWECAPSP